MTVIGAPTCNIVGDLVTSRRSGVSLPQTKYMHRSDTTVEQGRYDTMYMSSTLADQTPQ